MSACRSWAISCAIRCSRVSTGLAGGRLTIFAGCTRGGFIRVWVFTTAVVAVFSFTGVCGAAGGGSTTTISSDSWKSRCCHVCCISSSITDGVAGADAVKSAGCAASSAHAAVLAKAQKQKNHDCVIFTKNSKLMANGGSDIGKNPCRLQCQTGNEIS